MVRIGKIAPEDTVDITRLVVEEFDEDIAIVQGSMEEGVRLAKNLESQGYNVLIARGTTYDLLVKSNLNIPILPVPVTSVDIFDSINDVNRIGEDIPLILTKDMVSAVEGYQRIIGRELMVFEVQSEMETEQIIKRLVNEGIKVIAGLGIINKYATRDRL